MALPLQHSRIQKKHIRQKGCSCIAACLLCLTPAVSSSTEPALFYSCSIPYQWPSRQGRKHHLWNREERRGWGRGDTTYSPGTFFLKVKLQYLHRGFCFLLSFFKKKKASITCGCQGNKQSQSSREARCTLTWSSCSQAYRKGTIASTRQLLLLLEPGALLPPPLTRDIPLRHGCGRFQVPMQASTAIQSREPSFTAPHSCSQNHSLAWLFVCSCFLKISIFPITKLHKNGPW